MRINEHLFKTVIRKTHGSYIVQQNIAKVLLPQLSLASRRKVEPVGQSLLTLCLDKDRIKLLYITLGLSGLKTKVLGGRGIIYVF